MLEDLFRLSQNFIRIYKREYIRYFLKVNLLSNRFSIIIGQRGVGKTTAMIQYILSSYNNDVFTDKAIYIQADHFLVGKYSLYEIAEQFYNHGGELLCLDEIHKYSNWSKELKSINDTFPKLKIIASGSSALEIYKGTHDLSRRAVILRMFGLSFKEFIEITTENKLERYDIEEIIKNHQKISNNIVNIVEKKGGKILVLFKEYLEYGYYPYFNEFADKNIFRLTLEQNIHTTLESDLILIHPSLSGNSIKKIKSLLSIIASSVPFTPDLKKLKTILDIGDERTLKIYLKYMEDAGIIMSIYKGKGGLKELEKPEKIYLNNTNLIYAITDHKTANIGNIRETFFLNMLDTFHKASIPLKGDFLIDNKNIFEIGGKNKTFEQVKDLENAFLALDDIEIGFGNKIPLWLFGFLY
ncbi:ATP-binding protein [Candidatus Desantisbacteria bacterium]|nr:ATP-binding protein [Candidatus Desantisbacteria bacterium]